MALSKKGIEMRCCVTRKGKKKTDAKKKNASCFSLYVCAFLSLSLSCAFPPERREDVQETTTACKAKGTERFSGREKRGKNSL